MFSGSAIRVREKMEAVLLASAAGRGFLRKIFSKVIPAKGRPAINLYLFGSVGVGKTHLMRSISDQIADSHSFLNFQDFMHMATIHFGKHGSFKNIFEGKFLFLDEFDITCSADAVIFARALKQLMRQNISVIVNSNHGPSLAHLSPLLASSAQNLIELIKSNFSIFHINTTQDRRASIYENSHHDLQKIFYAPGGRRELEKKIQNYCSSDDLTKGVIETLGRACDFQKMNLEKKILYTSFEELFERNLSSSDFLRISKLFKVIFVKNIRGIKPRELDVATRFINFIDHAYFNRVKLYASLDIPLDAIYSEGSLRHKFARTISRLYEMSSNFYPACTPARLGA